MYISDDRPFKVVTSELTKTKTKIKRTSKQSHQLISYASKKSQKLTTPKFPTDDDKPLFMDVCTASKETKTTKVQCFLTPLYK